MAQTTLEARVAALEKQVAILLESRENGEQRPRTWKDTFGAFRGDEVMREIFEEARKIREKDREKARRGRRSKRKVKQ